VSAASASAGSSASGVSPASGVSSASGDSSVSGGSSVSGREPALRRDVATAARVLAGLGLVTAYGHVSARIGAAMLITPAADLATVTGSALVRVPLAASALPAGAPAEAWAHLALYRARPDAAAIARAQPPAAFAAAAVSVAALPLLHGQAAWLGESIPVHDRATLLRSADLAEQAARSLRSGEALLLRGNGAITLGAAPGIAVTRMWLLSAVCDVFLAARAAGQVRALSAEEIVSWRAVRDEMLPRLWRHLRRRAGQVAPADRAG
jgi:ribulose-5-phosphate 4-epimerase/fuculose-1-phosphate aldolase